MEEEMMPELPEVEMQRRYLAETSLHKRMRRIQILDPYIIKNVSSHEFKSKLNGAKLVEVIRRGKFLLVQTDCKYDFAVHFGMTGYLQFVPTKSPLKKYSRVLFTFKDNYDLRYLDMRKLGGLYLVPAREFNKIEAIERMGPEPLSPDFDFPEFKKLIERRSASVKALLLDQSFIAGIGNIYSDEILFQAGIRPYRKISTLNEKESKILFDELKRVLHKAIHHKANFTDLDDFFTLNRGKGKRCTKCGSNIYTKKISARTSYYCEICQK